MPFNVSFIYILIIEFKKQKFLKIKLISLPYEIIKVITFWNQTKKREIAKP